MKQRWVVFVLLVLPFCLYAERGRKLSAPSDSIAIICDTIRERDSMQVKLVAFLPDSLIVDTLAYEYKKIKDVAYRRGLTKELYKMIFVNPKRNYVNVMRTENTEKRFEPYEGKVINQIDFKVLPPYGYSVYDTTFAEDDIGWLEHIANKLHICTADATLRRQMTIEPGMILNSFVLVQNEILLRRLGYIDDVYIMVEEDTDDPTKVNLLVICRDDFSWGAEVSTDLFSNFQLSLSDKNFIHYGHQLKYEMSYRGDKSPEWGNSITYKVNSLYSSHFDFKGYYQNDYKSRQIYGTIERGFLTTEMKWAGGVGFYRVYRTDDFPGLSTHFKGEPFDYHANEWWIGRSMQLGRMGTYHGNIYLAMKVREVNFDNRPEVYVDTNYFYFNRRTVLGALTYQRLQYYRANLIYDFGRTEVIPSGAQTTLLLGYEKSDFETSLYTGYQFMMAHFEEDKERYYGFNFGIGGYMESKKRGYKRGVMKMDFHHVTNLISIGNCRLRFYDDVSFVRGIRRYPEDYLYFKDRELIGFSSDTLRGMQKITLSLSSTLFLPYIKKGFRMSVSTYVDYGIIGNLNTSLSRQQPHLAIGASLNIRNDNLIFKHLSFRVTYYPNVPPDMRQFSYDLTGRRNDSFYDFQVGKPDIVSYE